MAERQMKSYVLFRTSRREEVVEESTDEILDECTIARSGTGSGFVRLTLSQSDIRWFSLGEIISIRPAEGFDGVGGESS